MVEREEECYKRRKDMESEEKERYVASKRFYTPLLTLVTSNSLINSCVEREKETTSLRKKKKRALREKGRGCGDERTMQRWKGIQEAKREKKHGSHGIPMTHRGRQSLALGRLFSLYLFILSTPFEKVESKERHARGYQTRGNNGGKADT